MDPLVYRSETRRSTLIVTVTFIALAMLLSGLAVMLFGEPGGDNFRLNLGGVVTVVVVMVAAVDGRVGVWVAAQAQPDARDQYHAARHRWGAGG